MKRFILSIILLIVIIGVGQLLMHIALSQDQQPSEPTQAPTPADSISVTMSTDTITANTIPSDTTIIVTTK
jgi:flagellar basal body-associated protein FliL